MSEDLSVVEFAELTGAAAWTVRQWCKGGRIPAKKVSGVWRIPASVAEAMPITAREFSRRTGIETHTVTRLCREGVIRAWRRPVDYRLVDVALPEGETRRTAWEIAAGEVERVLSDNPVANRYRPDILESAEILEIQRRRRAQKKLDDVTYGGTATVGKSRHRTRVAKRRDA